MDRLVDMRTMMNTNFAFEHFHSIVVQVYTVYYNPNWHIHVYYVFVYYVFKLCVKTQNLTNYKDGKLTQIYFSILQFPFNILVRDPFWDTCYGCVYDILSRK